MDLNKINLKCNICRKNLINKDFGIGARQNSFTCVNSECKNYNNFFCLDRWSYLNFNKNKDFEGKIVLHCPNRIMVDVTNVLFLREYLGISEENFSKYYGLK